MDQQYDVFISYNSIDQALVTALASQLKNKQLHVFLDRWHLIPGQPWPERLRNVLSSCSAVAVCIGPGEMDPWQLREMYFALERQNREPGFSGYSAVIAGSQSIAGFLESKYVGGFSRRD